jgi:hypothetical protein
LSELNYFKNIFEVLQYVEISVQNIKFLKMVERPVWMTSHGMTLYGTIRDTMDNKNRNKGKHLSTLEKYHVYGISKGNLQMNDIHIETYNTIFEILHKLHTR